MDNPYWTSEGQRHHISLEAMRLLCFELLCIFEASRPLVASIEEQELEEERRVDESELSLRRLYQSHAFTQSSKALLQVALMVRAYDDQMKESDRCEEYKQHLASIDDGNCVGVLDGKDSFSLREACNKIIHAHEVRPLYERIDREVNNQELDQDLWYRTGEVQLKGKQHENSWCAVLYIQPFLELVLDSISLGDP